MRKPRKQTKRTRRFGRHRIMPALAPGLAARQTRDGEPSARASAMLLQRLNRINRAGRLKAARRTQPRAEQQAVAFDQANQQAAHHGCLPSEEAWEAA